MTCFKNTTSIDIPDHNHLGLDWHSWCIGVSTFGGFWYLEFGPLYIQWSKHG